MAEAETAPLEIAAAEVAIEGIAAGLRLRFRRRAAHRHALAYVRGLLSDVERKNGGQLAEQRRLLPPADDPTGLGWLAVGCRYGAR